MAARRAAMSWVFAIGALACSRAPQAPPSPFGVRNVVLVSLDTVRADHLGAYGATDAHTPILDALAAEGVRFGDVTAAAPSTLASHTSLFTGTWPHTHGIVRNGFRLALENRMLAEVLGEAGFECAGFIGSFALDQRFAIAQGFSTWNQDFDLLVDGRTRDQSERRASQVTTAALGWLDRREEPEQPLFLFVHYFDAHAPYDPPPPFDRLGGSPLAGVTGSIDDQRRAVLARQQALGGPEIGLDGAIVNGLTKAWIDRPMPGPTALDRELARRYAGEVAYVDSELGRLLAGLEARGVLQDALVIVIADHGETFWEHADTWNHGLAVYQTTVGIPWILRLPAARFAGTVVGDPVTNLDVLPTLLELCDLPAPAGVEGQSLVERLGGAPLGGRALFSGATQPGEKLERAELPWKGELKAQCVRSGSWKLVVTPYLGTQELFDLAADPGEQSDRLLAPDALAEEKRAELEAQLAAWRALAHPLPAEFDVQHRQETIDRLRQLGYK